MKNYSRYISRSKNLRVSILRFLLAVFVFTQLFITTPQTFAAPPSLEDQSYMYAALQYLTYDSGFTCSNFWATNIDPDDATNGTWFTSYGTLTKTRSGHILDEPEGEADCNQSWKDKAIDALGYGGNKRGFLTAIGYSVKSDGGAYHDDSNEQTRKKLRDLFANKFFGGTLPNISAAKPLLYLTLYKNFTIGCKATQTVLAANATPDQLQGDKLYKIYGPDGKEYIYTGELGQGKNITIGENVLPGTNQISCKDIAGKLDANNGELAKEYAKMTASTGEKPISPETSSGEADKGESTCKVDGIGWVVCPVMNFLGGLMDKMVAYLGDTFLKTNSDLVKADDSNGTYVAWKVFRNYANIAFIIAFLFVIYSQITGAGASNYGLKRMLPRLIIAAILVNVSFIICQLAVDISNSLGYGVSGLFKGITDQISNDSLKGTDSGTAWADAIGGTGGVLLAGIGVALALSLGILIPALIAVLIVVLILLARQAIIVLLIVVAPLAFVAYLLPNTEEWFKKWYKMFFNLLMVFPIIAGVFGASKLAAKIINNIGATQGDGNTLQIMALGITVIPFFIVPSLLKGAMSATGALGAKLQGYGDRATGNMGSKAKDNYKNSDFAKHRAQQAAIKKAQIKGGKYKGWSPVGRGRSLINRGINMVPGKYGSQRIARATSVDDKQHAENVEEASSMLATMTDKQIMGQAIDEKSSEAQREAAAMHIMTKGSHSDKKTLLESVNKDTFKRDSTRAAIADTYAKSEMASVYGKSIASDIRSGKAVDMQKKLLENSGDISATAVAGNANYARDVAAAHSEAKKPEASLDDQIAAGKIEALVANIDSDTSITPTVDANAALNGIRRPPSP